MARLGELGDGWGDGNILGGGKTGMERAKERGVLTALLVWGGGEMCYDKVVCN